MRSHKHADRTFLWIVIALVIVGSVIFVSAWLGLLAREEIRYQTVLVKHAISLVLGGVVLVLASNISYTVWKKYSFYIFLLSIMATMLVFIPGLGLEINAAHRWVSIFGYTFQPAEFLKIGFVIYFAALLSSMHSKMNTIKDGIVPIGIILGIVAALLLSQPDTGTLAVIFASALAMYITAGGYWRYVFGFAMAGVAGLAALALSRGYIMDRFLTFFDPSRDPLSIGYQIKQSLIAIGSGGPFGRGFGQSVQKFGYLPEPISDSIFAVAAEEFGFLGTVVIITLFLLFAYRGLHIAKYSPNQFSGLLVVGIVILILSQSFVNIGAMLGVVPLTGMPLIFVSHGGTALLAALFAVGIILNISKYKKS